MRFAAPIEVRYGLAKGKNGLGRELQHRDAGLVGPQPVTRLTSTPRLRAVDDGRVLLAIQR